VKILAFDTTSFGLSVALLNNEKIIPDPSLEPSRIPLSHDSPGLERAPHRKRIMHTLTERSAERGQENRGLVGIMGSSNDGSGIIVKSLISESGKQSEFLIPEIEKILRAQKIWYQDLALIATTNGPGSFTGTRIGLTTARTIKAAINLPLILVNSCEAIAFKYRKKSGKIFVVLDASNDEFFCAGFLAENEKLIQIMKPCLAREDELPKILPQENFFLCGTKNGDVVAADLIGVLAYEKFKNGEISQNLDPLYLRMPRISERKK